MFGLLRKFVEWKYFCRIVLVSLCIDDQRILDAILSRIRWVIDVYK